MSEGRWASAFPAPPAGRAKPSRLSAGFLVLLILVWLCLGHSSAGNSLPAYLLALLMLLTPELRVAALGALRGSAVLAIGLLLLGYLTVSGFWSANWNWPEWGSLAAKALALAGFVTALAGSARYWPEAPLGRLGRQGYLAWLTLLLICACFVSSALSVYLHYLLPEYQPLPEPSRLVALGQLENPVVASLTYGLALVLLLHRCLWGPGLPLWLLLALPLCHAVWLTESRGVYFGLALACSCLAADRLGLAVRWNLLAVLGLGGAVLGLVFIPQWSPSLLPEGLLPRGTSMRPEIWRAALQAVGEGSLLFGKGQLDPGRLTHGELTFLHPHSLPISALYFGGLVGLALLLGLVVAVVRSLLAAAPGQLRGLALGLVVFSFSVLLLDGKSVLTRVNFIWMLFWLPVAITAVLPTVRDEAGRKTARFRVARRPWAPAAS